MKLDDYTGQEDFIVAATIAFIQEAHRGQSYGPLPYFLHPVEVAQEATCLATNAGLEYMVTEVRLAALLHDVIEDTDYTADDLLTRYTVSTVTAVNLLTKGDGKYLDEIQKIVDSRNTVAMIVKLADNLVNRRGDKSTWDEKRAARKNAQYDASIAMLTEALAGFGIYVNIADYSSFT